MSGMAAALEVRNNPLIDGKVEIRFTLGEAERVDVRIYDIAGRLIRRLADDRLPAGNQVVTWDGRDGHARALPPGLYYARVSYLDSGTQQATQIVILK